MEPEPQHVGQVEGKGEENEEEHEKRDAARGEGQFNHALVFARSLTLDEARTERPHDAPREENQEAVHLLRHAVGRVGHEAEEEVEQDGRALVARHVAARADEVPAREGQHLAQQCPVLRPVEAEARLGVVLEAVSPFGEEGEYLCPHDESRIPFQLVRADEEHRHRRPEFQ